MKKISYSLLVSVLLIPFAANAQNPVPNSGFENWSGGNPVSWSTNNVATIYTPVTQTSPGYSGASAAKGDVVVTPSVNVPPFLSSTDMTGTGFPVTQLYSTFSFYYKFTQVGATTLVPSAAIFQSGGTLVSAASQNISAPASSFTLVSLPFYTFGVNPATCQIAFTLTDTSGANIAAGNSFVVDEVALSNGVGVEEISSSPAISKITPNPASGEAFIYYSVPFKSDVTFQVMNVTGKILRQFSLYDEIRGQHKLEFNVSGLPPGFYMIKMESNGVSSNFPFVVAQ